MGPVRERPDDSTDPAGAAGEDDGTQDGVPEAVAIMFTDDIPHTKNADTDERAHAAWRSWLGALARDPKAAMAAALAYESLSDSARDAWLTALDTDAPSVRVPRVALYAPLLAVEVDLARRERIEQAMAAEGPHGVSARHALRGLTPNGDTLCVIVSPLYLDFVELLVCQYGAGGVVSARHEPLSHLRDDDPIPEAAGTELELTPVPMVVEELAHAVVAHRRAGKPAPEALQRFSHLFAPNLGAEDE